MYAFEMEKFLSPPTASSNSGRHDKCRRPVPKRIRNFFAVICCLVVLALVLNLVGSTLMVVRPHNDLKNNDTKSYSYLGVLISDHTAPPTILPTQAPYKRPTSSPQSSSLPSSQTYPSSTSPLAFWTHSQINNNTNNNNNAPMAVVPLHTKHTATNASVSFVERWCDLSGTDWYPTGTRAWQQRAPAFMIPGAKMSGTLTLASYLLQHPDMTAARSKDLQFFYHDNFRRYVTAKERTKVQAARERIYARDFAASDLQKDTQKRSLDATPGYLFYSSLLPRRILCVLPWIKLVVIVRDPVERVLAHYQSAIKMGLRIPLDDWIAKDFRLMDKVGLLNTTTSTATTVSSASTMNAFSVSPEEDVAWYEYQTAALEGALGRGLYEIQLRQWFQALRAVGRNPADSVLIVRTELLQSDPAGQYQQILQFLGMSKFDGASFALPVVPANNATLLPSATRRKLQDFYDPYNARLTRLLQSYQVRMAV
jgi:hypothetical protein